MIRNPVTDGGRRVRDQDPALRCLFHRNVIGAAARAENGPAARHGGQVSTLQHGAPAEQPHDVRIMGVSRRFPPPVFAVVVDEFDPFPVETLANPIGNRLPVQMDGATLNRSRVKLILPPQRRLSFGRRRHRPLQMRP